MNRCSTDDGRPYEEHSVPRPAQKVILLRLREPVDHDLPVPLERLGQAAHALDDLRRCIEPIVTDPRWPALEWRVACTPLMVRLPTARQSLADLGEVRAGLWPDTDWAVRLRAARDEVERRLQDVSMSMSSLLRTESSRTGTVAGFGFDGIKLAEAVDGLCGLIASRYPEAADSI
jgi:hypothetical protein